MMQRMIIRIRSRRTIRLSQEQCPDCCTRKVQYEVLRLSYMDNELELIEAICDTCLEQRLCHLKQPKSQRLLSPVITHRDKKYER